MSIISRRDSMKWAAAAMAVLPLAAGKAMAQDTTAPVIELSPVAPWPDVVIAPVTGPGYGTDPDLMEAKTPWPLILDDSQVALLDALSNLILPADDISPGAGEVGTSAFINEWVSSPYDGQRGDHDLMLRGLMWLDAQARAMTGMDFVSSPPESQTRILDALVTRRSGPLDRPSAFFERLRVLIVVGFYTLPEGKAAMDFHGNTPVIGAYPGPTDEAMAHLHDLLASLNLKDPGKPWETV